jgi:uncharacterized membrane protein
MQVLIAYGLTIVGFLAIDGVWLATMTAAFYKPRLGGLLLDKPDLVPALVFYLVYCAGVVGLAVRPALQSGEWIDALWRGALLGLVAYGTYDLTNQATLKGWSLELTIVDMIWGTVLTGAAASFATIATKWLRP